MRLGTVGVVQWFARQLVELKMGVQLPSPTHMIEILNFQPNYVTQVADLYDRVFTGPPWFDPPLGQEEAVKYIQKELGKTLAIALLALNENLPVGFAWGYQLTTSDFADSKYNNPDSKQLVLKSLPSLNYFYISEIGIDPAETKIGPKYRGKGYATTMATQLSQGRIPLLMRTIENSPMRKIAENQLQMTPVVAPWLNIQDPENDRRVIYIKV